MKHDSKHGGQTHAHSIISGLSFYYSALVAFKVVSLPLFSLRQPFSIYGGGGAMTERTLCTRSCFLLCAWRWFLSACVAVCEKRRSRRKAAAAAVDRLLHLFASLLASSARAANLPSLLMDWKHKSPCKHNTRNHSVGQNANAEKDPFCIQPHRSISQWGRKRRKHRISSSVTRFCMLIDFAKKMSPKWILWIICFSDTFIIKRVARRIYICFSYSQLSDSMLWSLLWYCDWDPVKFV